MTVRPLLAAVDVNGSEQFLIIMFDPSTWSINHMSDALSEREAVAFFQGNGETATDIERRLESARHNIG